MNTSSELGTLNSTLRIAIWCFTPTFWLDSDSSGVGVAWHGTPAWDFADMKSRIGLRYEVVTELPGKSSTDPFQNFRMVTSIT